MNKDSRVSPIAVLLCTAATGLLLTGCSIKEHVSPVSAQYIPQAEVCVIENPRVREGFLPEFKSVLRQRGYAVKMLPEDGTLIDCPTVSTYVARWSWDLTIYMSYAEIRVYAGGKQVGEAVYDATHGGGRLDKFIDAEPKIRELVEELFPVREARAAQ